MILSFFVLQQESPKVPKGLLSLRKTDILQAADRQIINRIRLAEQHQAANRLHI